MANRKTAEQFGDEQLVASPGNVLVQFTTEYHGFDFGSECQHFKAGDKIEVGKDLAATLAREYGAGCPFTIAAENKAIGKAPETK